MKRSSMRPNSGFSLLEVVITVGIMISMTIAVTVMLRSGFEVRAGLGQEARVTHRLNLAMTQLVKDISHGFVLSLQDQVRSPIERATKTIFRIELGSDADKLALTTLTHQSIMANAGEGDQAFVVYELRDATEIPGRKDLYRGEVMATVAEFREDPPMHLLAKNIKKMKITAWRGDDWLKDRWDSSRSDTRNRMPRLVKIELSSWATDLEAGESAEPGSEDNVVDLMTIVQPAMALGFTDLKQPMSSMKIH